MALRRRQAGGLVGRPCSGDENGEEEDHIRVTYRDPAVQHPVSQFGRTGGTTVSIGHRAGSPVSAQLSVVELDEGRPLAQHSRIDADVGDDTKSRMPTASELRAELLAARQMQGTLRPKTKTPGTAAKPRQRRANTATGDLLSNKKPRFRIVNSPAVDADAACAAAEHKRRLLKRSAEPGHFRQPGPMTPLFRQPTVSDEDVIADADDDEPEPATQLRLRSHAVQPRDLDLDTLESLTTPQPQHQHPAADARGQTAAGKIAASPAQAVSETTPATNRGLPLGAKSRHALLARLATTPRPGPARPKAQQRTLVKGSGLHAHLQRALQRMDEQHGPAPDILQYLEAEVLDTAREAHCIKLRCSCKQPGPALAFVLISMKALRNADVGVGSRLLLRKWQQLSIDQVTLPVLLVHDAETLS